MERVRTMVANGLHEPAPKCELEELLGKDGMKECEVLNHDAEDETQIEHIGRTSFGTKVSGRAYRITLMWVHIKS